MNKVEFDLWPKQVVAFTSPATEILYGGAAGPGKSHLMRVAFICWALAIPGLQLYLFRREYRDLLQNHMEGPTGFRAMLAPLTSRGDCEIVALEIRFSNGSRINLCHCQHEKDVFGYQGAEIHVLGLEEATQFTEFQVRYLRSRVRIPDSISIPAEYKGMFPRCFYTSNPGGIGHGYFKRAFVDPVAPFSIWQVPDQDGGFTRQFIPARISDNPSVNPTEYRKRLMGLGSEQFVRALLDGDWNAVVGAYFDVFDRVKHVITDFKPPSHWFKFRSFDWGSSAPFAVLWWCVSDGEPFNDSKGKTCKLPRRSLICYREWYGCSSFKESEGLGMRNEDVAAGIVERTKSGENIQGTVTDSLPFQDKGGETIGDVFAKNGVPLVRGDTSRIPGWSQLRSGLIGIDGTPMIYLVESCVHLIRTLPALQRSVRDPEDIEDGQEDHAPDAARLAAMAHKVVRDSPKPPVTEIKPERVTVNQALKQHFKRRAREQSVY